VRFFGRSPTTPRGTVLDPFAGSGSTLVAAYAEGFSFIGIEREEEYVRIARARVADILRRENEHRSEHDLMNLFMEMDEE
jgi:DNA modification methylase